MDMNNAEQSGIRSILALIMGKPVFDLLSGIGLKMVEGMGIFQIFIENSFMVLSIY